MQKLVQSVVRAAVLGGILLCFLIGAGALAEFAPLWLASLGFVAILVLAFKTAGRA